MKVILKLRGGDALRVPILLWLTYSVSLLERTELQGDVQWWCWKVGMSKLIQGLKQKGLNKKAMKTLETEPWSSENFYLAVTSVIFITRQSSKYCRCQLAKSI